MRSTTANLPLQSPQLASHCLPASVLARDPCVLQGHPQLCQQHFRIQPPIELTHELGKLSTRHSGKGRTREGRRWSESHGCLEEQCRSSLESQFFPVQIQISGSKRINSVIISATMVTECVLNFVRSGSENVCELMMWARLRGRN